MDDLLDSMCQRVHRHADPKRRETALPRLGIAVLQPHSVPAMTMCGPGICLVLQGAKQMLVGDKIFRYGAGSCFASLIELPTTRIIFEADGDKPYIATSLTLDPALCLAVMADIPSASSNRSSPCFNVAVVSRELVEAWHHYLALIDTPNDIPALAAVRERELVYRLLQSPHGSLIRQIARDEGKLAQVRRAIDWMRQHFAEPFPVKALADIAGMTVPSFNRQFRAATSTSPLQYQKTLRLQAARRLLATNADAARAAYAVGYESASQFNREYSRLFGCPPKQDASRLRENIGAVSDIMI